MSIIANGFERRTWGNPLVAENVKIRVPQKSALMTQKVSDLDPRIIGGRPAEEDEITYQIQLRRGAYHFCGGSLVEVTGKQVVLTAAHCFNSWDNPDDYTVVAGELDLSEDSGSEQVRQVTGIIPHPNYDEATMRNDIAILQIEPHFELNNHVQPIKLPKRNFTSNRVVVSGWGITEDGIFPDHLQVVTLDVVSNNICKKNYAKDGIPICKDMICAGSKDQDSCQGDSGGPLRDASSNELVGIVSFGIGCGQEGYPGVNTRVSRFTPWIKETVKKLY